MNEKYPIGTFEKPKSITAEHIEKWIQDIANFPIILKQRTQSLTPKELQYQYRENGWNIAKVTHHCADSHLNSYIRFKLAVTEDTPTIKPYEEAIWANFTDAKQLDITNSLSLLEGLHNRWVFFLQSLTEKQLERTFFHPEHQKHFTLKENIGVYAWHSNHHLSHIELALQKKIIQ